jgi:hypothetical protein
MAQADRMRSIGGLLHSGAPAHIRDSNGPLGAFMQTGIDAQASLQSGEALARGGMRALASRSVDGASVVDSSSHAHTALAEPPSLRRSGLKEELLMWRRMSMDGYGMSAPLSNRSRAVPETESYAAKVSRDISSESVQFLLDNILHPDSRRPVTGVRWHAPGV